MGFATKRKTQEVTAPPRISDGSNSSITIEDPLPWEVPMPAPTLPKPAHPPILAPAMKFLADLEAAGKDRPLLMKFLADVKAAGKYRPLLMLLQDFTEHGLHPGLITSAEKVFEEHPDLLVAFNTFLLAGDYQLEHHGRVKE